MTTNNKKIRWASKEQVQELRQLLLKVWQMVFGGEFDHHDIVGKMGHFQNYYIVNSDWVKNVLLDDYLDDDRKICVSSYERGKQRCEEIIKDPGVWIDKEYIPRKSKKNGVAVKTTRFQRLYNDLVKYIKEDGNSISGLAKKVNLSSDAITNVLRKYYIDVEFGPDVTTFNKLGKFFGYTYKEVDGLIALPEGNKRLTSKDTQEKVNYQSKCAMRACYENYLHEHNMDNAEFCEYNGLSEDEINRLYTKDRKNKDDKTVLYTDIYPKYCFENLKPMLNFWDEFWLELFKYSNDPQYYDVLPPSSIVVQTVRQVVSKYLEDNNLTEEEFAKLCGFRSPVSISNLLHYDARTILDHVVKVLNFIDMNDVLQTYHSMSNPKTSDVCSPQVV